MYVLKSCVSLQSKQHDHYLMTTEKQTAVDCIIINTTDIGVTPVNFLLACYNQISKDYMNNKTTIADALGAMQRCFQEALELEKQYKPHMPVNIHNGVRNILIHVKDGVIHVKTNPITKQDDSGGAK